MLARWRMMMMMIFIRYLETHWHYGLICALVSLWRYSSSLSQFFDRLVSRQRPSVLRRKVPITSWTATGRAPEAIWTRRRSENCVLAGHRIPVLRPSSPQHSDTVGPSDQVTSMAATSSVPYYRSTASSKANSSQTATECFVFLLPESSRFIKVIQ